MSLVDIIDPSLLVESEFDHRYTNSPFRNLKNMLPRQKGSRFEKIVTQVYEQKGHTIFPAISSEHDSIINGKKCEIKGSCLVNNKNIFSFLQIRPNQDYDIIIFAMFYPDDLVVMEMDKSIVLEQIKKKTFKSQHGGISGNSGTYCYYGNKESLYDLGAVFFK